MSDVLQQLRTGDREESIEILQSITQDIEGEEKDIDIPDRSDLQNKRIWLPEEPDGNVNVNGTWCHPLYARINNLMADNGSPIIIIVGEEGKGKSMTALVLLHYLHNKLNILRGDFNPHNQTIYGVIEFLLLVRGSTRTGLMFDEANETINSNEYNSRFNHAVAGAIRTQRKRENAYVFVGPEYKELDPRVRKKVHLLIDVKSERYATVRSYRLKHAKRGNRGLDYNYTHYPDWKIPEVPADLKETYETIDNQFKGNYLDQLLLGVLEERMSELQEEKTVTL